MVEFGAVGLRVRVYHARDGLLAREGDAGHVPRDVALPQFAVRQREFSEGYARDTRGLSESRAMVKRALSEG